MNFMLKTWRLQLDLTQQEVADKMGITRETYSSYEQGRRIPNTYSLFELEEALGVPARMIYNSFNDPVVLNSIERSK